MKHYLSFIGALLLVLLISCNQQKTFKKGNMYHGFKLIEKKYVKEVGAECLYFEHEKSGAKLMKIINDDTNKLFGIAFKTLPENDCGTPHIMEHSVLNGSKNFPVKSPFDQLMQGSLNTFLNAMTSSDWTMYPVASMNDKDYFNLMHVYLDAVFNPLIYTDERILMQEGWHYELASAAAEVEYKGVVYNEMKGAFSSPGTELSHYRNKLLFPNSPYGYSAGGHPDAIPQLTHTDFLKFHQKFYHPSNSYIMLYGNGDIHKELSFIDSQYLSNYERSAEKIEIALQEPFDTVKTEVREYALADGESTANKTYLSMSYVAGLSTDQKLSSALQILAEALVNHEQGPLRRALLEAGIGQNVDASLDDTYQNVFEISVQNANPEDQQKFNETVQNTLKKVVAEGLDKAIVDGILNRIEFSLREGNTPQKGLVYFFMNLRGWMFADNPFLGLEYETILADLKKGIDEGYLIEVINNYLINNNHALSLAMVPKPGLQAQLNKKTEFELAQYKASLSPAAIDSLIAQTTALIEYQQREDSDSAKATIPSLTLADVGKESQWYSLEEKAINNTKVLHCNQFANGIVYANLFFDARVLPTSDIGYIQLLSELLGKMPTENYTFGDLENALNSKTGDFSTSFTWFLENRSDDSLRPKIKIGSKAMRDKTNDMFGLMAEVLTKTNFADYERLRELLVRHQADVELRMKQNGLIVARTRVFSYFSNEGMLQELKGGLQYLRFLSDLVQSFDVQKEVISQKLKSTAETLFTNGSLVAATTCSEEDYKLFTDGLSLVTSVLPNTSIEPGNWVFNLKSDNEGIQTASKVNYVLQGGNFIKLGYQWNGNIQVLEQLLSTDFLQTRVRVIGGAYGGFARFSPSGIMYMGSYRDPNLKETLDNFAAIPAYLDSLQLDEKALTKFIIGTIGNIDQPTTPAQKGDRAFYYYFSGVNNEMLQKERTQILSTTLSDIKAYKPMIENVLLQNSICVYGSEEKLKQNQATFKSLIKI